MIESDGWGLQDMYQGGRREGEQPRMNSHEDCSRMFHKHMPAFVCLHVPSQVKASKMGNLRCPLDVIRGFGGFNLSVPLQAATKGFRVQQMLATAIHPDIPKHAANTA